MSNKLSEKMQVITLCLSIFITSILLSSGYYTGLNAMDIKKSHNTNPNQNQNQNQNQNDPQQKQEIPYGYWPSPITPELITKGINYFGNIVIDGNDIYWTEQRPSEKGRSVLIQFSSENNQQQEALQKALNTSSESTNSNTNTNSQSPPPPKPTPTPTETPTPTPTPTETPFNVRTKVHEYGGAPYTVDQGTIYFINFKDQQLYKKYSKQISNSNTQTISNPQPQPLPLTPPGSPRFANMHPSPYGLYAIGEEQRPNNEPENFIALIDTNTNTNTQSQTHTGKIQKVVTGKDFYSSPVPNKDFSQLAWISWNHPNMPWDATELFIGDITQDGRIINSRTISGGNNESVMSPKWGADGSLYFISDRSGWWNLYRWCQGAINPIFPMDREFGGPHWVFGQSSYALFGDKILASYMLGSQAKLAVIDPCSKIKIDLDLPGTAFSDIQVNSTGTFAAFIMGSSVMDPVVVKLDLTPYHRDQRDHGDLNTLSKPTITPQYQILAKNIDLNIDQSYFSTPQQISFPSTNGRITYAYYYPPQNKETQGPHGELPPLIVKSHGGPTGNASHVFNLKIQYWTSRGFAVLDVDYGGSSGYGRAYRERLKGMWGIVDREDVENGALFLVKQGLVHPKKLAITGSSAGGYTTLSALTFGEVFNVGASYYGVSDLELLTKETHKFESRYLDGLVGPYPEMKEVYFTRSPINFADKIKVPIIFFQGREDEIVPPIQAETLYHALKNKGLKTELIIYEGEQHGFRQSETVKDALTRELKFYLESGW